MVPKLEKQNYVEQRTVTSASLLLAWRCMVNTYGLKIQRVEVGKGKAMPLRRERVEIVPLRSFSACDLFAVY
jgi:hypothetical protein